MSKNKFARSQLTKHGWTEGSGLGKNESGITDAIKVKLKHDTAGVGHNKGDEFTFQWWDHVFNKAANSISVKSSDDGVAVKKVGDSGPVSNKKTKTYNNKAMLYGQFVKGATLTNGNEDHIEEGVESSEDEETEKIKMNRLMDDNMVEICGGMTAHKAARHGHKLSAKMARVMEQEKQELEKLNRIKELKQNHGRKRTRSQTLNDTEEDKINEEDNKSVKKKKKKKKNRDQITDSDLHSSSENAKKRKEKVDSDENMLIDGYHSAISNNCIKPTESETMDIEMSESSKKKSKKKKRKKEKIEETDANENKKRKKRKH
ncbi:G patch domain-containing protein 4-like [Mytilus californianus]|uniref:G patch domain-containing protein 4-like n=1 Tax=Mytilus californianus TaxID=6549 RepID=UPI002245C287|nr:G patch domain-containing protein 4-like [Mytilus californianus]